ncbi:MAG: D-alanyl-D-alanine carboxypeptidase [Sumerlaeia bacterium]
MPFFPFGRDLIPLGLASALCLAATLPGQTIPEEIDDLLDEATILDYEWTILFEDEDGSTIYYDRNADVPHIPASNTKIFTTAAAFGILGETYTFETRVYYDGTLSAGTLNGDIVLISEHDPSWNTSVFGSGNADAALQAIAALVKSAGVDTINGRVEGYGAMIYNYGSTSEGHQFTAQDELNREAAVAFRSALIDNGVSFGSVINSAGFDTFTIPGGSTLLVTYQSDALQNGYGDDLDLFGCARILNKVSHNVMADLFLMHLGYVDSGTSSFAAGETAVLDWLQNTAGVDNTGAAQADGSGLSRDNFFSARQTVDTIRYMLANHPTYDDTLPISAVDGTLGSRLGGTLAGDVHAKTGTLPNSGVVSLSGYIDHPLDGDRYLFSIYANTPGADTGGEPIAVTTTRDAIDDVVRVLGEDYPPFSPNTLAVLNQGGGTVRVEWSNPAVVTDGYEVYAADQGQPLAPAASVAPAYIIESGAGGLNNADYSDTGGFENSSAHSTAPGLSGAVGSRFIRPTTGNGTATFAPSGLAQGRYRVDVTCFDFASANAPGTTVTFNDADGIRSSVFELSEQTAGDRWRGVGTFDFVPGQGHSVAFANALQVTTGADDRMNPAAVRFIPLYFEESSLAAGQRRNYRVTAEGPGGETKTSDVFQAVVGSSPAQILVVDGFDRWNTYSDNADNESHDFAAITAASIPSGRSVDTVANEMIEDGTIDLASYFAAVYVLGEESTIDEAFSDAEQPLVEAFQTGGGHLFVSGSEIAWDLDRPSGPSTADRAFMNNVLFAAYAGDDAATYTAAGAGGSIFSGVASLTFDNGTNGTYDVNFPDMLTPTGTGAIAAMTYSGGSGGNAAVTYDGSNGGGKVVFLGFPFETIVDQIDRDDVMTAAMNFFGTPSSLDGWMLFE